RLPRRPEPVVRIRNRRAWPDLDRLHAGEITGRACALHLPLEGGGRLRDAQSGGGDAARRCARRAPLLRLAAIQHRLVLAAFLEEVDRLVVLQRERELHVVLAAGLLLAGRGRLERLAAPRLVAAERARAEIRVRHRVADRHAILRRVAAVALARMLLRVGPDQRRVVLRRRRQRGRADPDQGDDEKVGVTHGHSLLRYGLARRASDRTNAAVV